MTMQNKNHAGAIFYRYAGNLMAVVITVIIAAACAGSAKWKVVDEGRTQYKGRWGLSASLPPRWLMFENRSTGVLLLTRHSIPMEFVHIKRQELFRPMQYSYLTINAGMKTYEAAEVVINNLRATPGVFDLTVEELAPAQVGGLEGFELLLTYATDNGMRRRCLIYGTIVGDKYYAEIGLYALEDYYFGATLKDFLELVGSVSIADF